ncbi:hypothetical protein LWI29_003125 [Acer saccharum]|uniref:Uncharacterized protein n=1 Tax=Acer saccharum TaxID=4024 RepID=A0AA39RP89_ACESA|nr:hypothetical protein LWI29_003125 [Acer saccharum]
MPEHQPGNLKLKFRCEINSQDGEQNVERMTDYLFSVSYPGRDYIRSSHVIIGFGFHFLHKICGNELSFRFFVKKDPWSLRPENCKVVKCGVHFMLAKHLKRLINRGFIRVQVELKLNITVKINAITHCGASLLLEAMMTECQLVLLPNFGDQIIQARLMGGDLKVGVEVEKGEEDELFTREGV